MANLSATRMLSLAVSLIFFMLFSHSFHLSQLLLSLPSSFCLHYPDTLLYFFSFPCYPTSKRRASPFLGSVSASLSSTSLLFPFNSQYFSSMSLLHFSIARNNKVIQHLCWYNQIYVWQHCCPSCVTSYQNKYYIVVN